mmetsp:Transcript_4842/g.15022  ORF Transcript_4842/g.15022 Transcript_4842/m.15022 type:complete len:238 (-) Transcript_4842:439-1152(-)
MRTSASWACGGGCPIPRSLLWIMHACAYMHGVAKHQIYVASTCASGIVTTHQKYKTCDLTGQAFTSVRCTSRMMTTHQKFKNMTKQGFKEMHSTSASWACSSCCRSPRSLALAASSARRSCSRALPRTSSNRCVAFCRIFCSSACIRSSAASAASLALRRSFSISSVRLSTSAWPASCCRSSCLCSALRRALSPASSACISASRRVVSVTFISRSSMDSPAATAGARSSFRTLPQAR